MPDGNFFDQFDARSAAQPATNFFDQFDHASEQPSPSPGLLGTALQAGLSGIRKSITDIAHAPTAFEDRPLPEPDKSPVGQLLGQPISQGWSDPKWWTAQIAHGLAASSPSLALGAAGALAGTAVPILGETGVGEVAGGAAGFALGSALQEIAPAYQAARAGGLDHDAAVHRALVQTGIGTAFGAAMGLAPAAVGRLIERPLSRALAEIFVVQPGLGAAQQETEGVAAGKAPTAEELATGYAQNVGVGLGLMGAHAAVRQLRRSPETPPTAVAEAEPAPAPPPTPAVGPAASPDAAAQATQALLSANIARQQEEAATPPLVVAPPESPRPEPAVVKPPEALPVPPEPAPPPVEPVAPEAVLAGSAGATEAGEPEPAAEHNAVVPAGETPLPPEIAPAEPIRAAETREEPIAPTPAPQTETPPVRPAQAPQTEPPILNGPIVTAETHTKTGKDIFAVRFPVKPDIDGLGAQARQLGGYWSSFRGNGMQPGWMFKTPDAAEQFAAWARERMAARDVAPLAVTQEQPPPAQPDEIPAPAGVDPDAWRIGKQVAAAREATETEPTEAQKTAGNYAKGRVNYYGLNFVMENPEGSTRRGTDANGQPWESVLPADYGYISRTEGADGDHVDAYLGPNHESKTAFVVDQVDPGTGAFDEHKAMLGFPNWASARNAYEDAFSDGRGRERIGNVTPMSLDEFKTWLTEGDTKNPIGQGALDLGRSEAASSAMPARENPQIAIARAIADRLSQQYAEGVAPLSARELQGIAESIYGSRLAEGRFTRDDIYNALELGVNRYVAGNRQVYDPRLPLPEAEIAARRLTAFKESLPTQTVRAGEREQFQQFSTPPDYAYAAAWAANLKPEDHVLEPSAGTGSLVAPAKNSGASVTTNEISPQRAALVESLGVNNAFHEDAEQLHNILPEEVRPSVVLMNPPFSAAGTRMAGKTVLNTGANHVEQALQRLEPGGRLVAILGRGMGIEMQPGRYREGSGAAFAPWWKRIGEQYDVRANVGVPGEVYGKYGTQFGTRLVVIDKVPPSGRPIVTGEAADIPDLMARLDEVRNDRPTGTASQQVAAEPRREAVAPGGEGVAGPGEPLSVPTVEPGVRAGSAAAGPRAGVPVRPQPSSNAIARPETEPRPGDAVAGKQPEQPGRPGGTEPRPLGNPPNGEVVGGGGAEPDGMVLRPEGGARPVLPAERDDPSVEIPEAAKIDEIAAAPETGGEITEQVYEPYRPQRISVEGAQDHPGKLVQSAAMASVMPPAVDYAPRLPKDLITKGALSAAQLEPIVYAGHAHSQMLPAAEGETAYRKGFFIGDGCVAAGTRIYNPKTDQHVPIERLVGTTHTVLALTKRGFEPCEATLTFLKGTANLYRVTLEDGRAIVVTQQHRLLTPAGWRHLANLRLNDLVASADTVRAQSRCQSDRAVQRPAAFAWRYYSRWQRITSIEFVGCDKFYDMYVPGPENYVAEGFINHNTGVGKGREVAGIILDNWMQGRRKALWISEKRPLIEDARRDWKGLGRDSKQIFDVGKTKPGDQMKAGDGIAFLTYDTLKGSERLGKDEQGKKKAGQTRLDQIVNWLGKDFDGVIAFDEAHGMANALQMKGDRGVSEPSQKALAGLELQKRLPNARIVYVSATGATEVSNLAYAERLGLWGRGTAFPTKHAFVSQVEQGGVAAMELVARDLKALGSYAARSLSYDGVEYDRLEHTLTPEQREIYDTLAEAWQVTLNNFNKALEVTQGSKSRNAKSAAASAFWGAHQRFFNQIITALQMPTVLRGVERDIAEGRQAVLQLVNTNEASQTRALAKVEGEADLEDLDMTPRDQLMQLIEHSFPTTQHETYIDENGNERTRPVKDSQGNLVENKQAVVMREALLDKLGSIRVPDGPLEMLLNHFGTGKVAEVTGRGQRVVRKADEDGQVKTQVETRPASANIAEADAFQNGKKPILVFSQAGGTGRSYHADNNAASSGARRSHYLVQAGWRADTAIQGFGRTHRTNQASAPIYHLVTTDLEGQRRFISSIARRLSQLGALTKGERRAGEQGLFSARDNLESQEARDALYGFYRDLYFQRVPEITIDEFERQTGLRLRDENGNLRRDLPPITTFLNRLLSLKYDLQNQVFRAFEGRLNDAVDRAAASGTLDVGTETLRADRIRKEEDRVVHSDPQSGAETRYVRFAVENRTHPASFDQIMAGGYLTGGREPVFFVRSKLSGKISAVAEAKPVTDTRTGSIVEQYRMADPLSYDFVPRSRIDYGTQYWERIDNLTQARQLWDAQVAQIPQYRSRDLHMITGAVLPIWDRLSGRPKVYRLQTAEGERFLGREVPEDDINRVLSALNVEATGKRYAPQEIVNRVLQGDHARLANGWGIKRALVAGEPRLELIGPDYRHRGELGKDGAFVERIGYQTRFFIPTGDHAAEVLARVTERRPVTEMTGTREGLEESTAERAPVHLFGGYVPLQDRLEDFRTFTGDLGDPHDNSRAWVLGGNAAEAPYERLALVDPRSGAVTHAVTSGLPNFVGLPPRSELPAGGVAHHNHPSGGSLSGGDLDLVEKGLVDTVVAHSEGNTFAARLSAPYRAALDEGQRPLIETAHLFARIAGDPLIRREVKGYGGKLDPREANIAFSDLVNRGLARAGLIDYMSTVDPAAILGRDLAAAVERRINNVLADKTPQFYGSRTERDNRSAAAVRPEEAMARIQQMAEDAAARRSPGAGGAGGGRRSPPGGEGLSAPSPFGPPPDEIAADLAQVHFTDERPFGQRVREWLQNLRQDAWLRFRLGWQDRLAGAERAERQAKAAGVPVTAATSPILSLRYAKNAANVARLAVEHTQVRYNAATGVVEPIEGSKPYVSILKPLADQGRPSMDAFAAWTIARRAARLTVEGRERNVPPEFITKYQDLDKSQPDGGALFRSVDRELQGWYDHLLDFAEQTGLLSGETRRLFARGDYVPFFRALEDSESVSGPKGGAGNILRSPIRMLKGGEARINNIYENGVIAAASIIRRGMVNVAREKVADTLDKIGAVTPLGKAERNRLDAELADPALDANLRAAGIDPDKLSADAKAGTKGLWSALRQRDDDIIGFMRNGKPAYFRVNDPFLYRGLTTLGPGRFDGIVRILAQPARLLRAAVILDPSFMLRHNIRMAQQAFESDGINPFSGMTAALRQVKGLDPVALKLMAAGAVSGRYDVDLPQQIRRQMMTPEYRNSLIDTPLKALKFIGHLSETAMRASDLGPRVAVYEKAIREGVPEAEAIDRARDVLDFSTRGDSEIANFFAQTIPFLNARWQGIARSARALAGPTRKAVLARGLLITAATVALWYENKDKPEWQALPDWDRQYATHFWIDGVHYRIPRNWEFAALFQTIPEIILQYMENGDSREATNATSAMIDNVFKINPVTFVPAGIRPLLDAYYNTDSYTGSPIVNEAEARKLVDDRYAPGTSPAVIAMTHAYNTISPHPIAPATMEFLLRGYMAGWGAYIAAAADYAGESLGLEGSRPTPRLTDYPVIGAVAQETPQAGNRIQTDFYELRQQIEQVGASLKAAQQTGDTATMAHIQVEHPEYSKGLESALNRANTVLSRQRQILNLRLADPAVSADDKRQAQDQFWAWRDQYMIALQPLLRRAEGLTQ